MSSKVLARWSNTLPLFGTNSIHALKLGDVNFRNIYVCLYSIVLMASPGDIKGQGRGSDGCFRCTR